MSSSTAELTLILKAQNLAKTAIGDLTGAVANVGEQAQVAGGKLSAAFTGKGQQLARELGDLTVRILNGQNWTEAGLAAGATLAGGLVTAFGEKIVEKIAGSALFATISGALSTAGATIGSIVSTAIPVGMALAPYLIGAAIVAAIAFLVTHPEIAGEALRIGGTIVGGILGGLSGLAGKILGMVVAAPGAIAEKIGGFVGGLVGWFWSLPGRLVELGGELAMSILRGVIGVFASLWDWFVGRVKSIIFGSREGRVFEGLVHGTQEKPGGHAKGGWVGLHGPELSWLGERGPEYVIPNHRLGQHDFVPASLRLMMSGREIGRVNDVYVRQGARRGGPALRIVGGAA